MGVIELKLFRVACRLGPKQSAKPRTYQTFAATNSTGEPDLVFEFHYRTRGKCVGQS